MAKGIWVIAEQKEGKLTKVTLELLSKATEMAQQAGEEVTVLLLGSQVEGLAAEMGAYGANKVMVFDHYICMNFHIKVIGHLPQGVEEENIVLLFTDYVPFFITS